MPEGHTLHRLANALDAAFLGTSPAVSSPQGRFAAAAALIDGTRYVAGSAHGKHLFVEFADERIVHVHLGLIGKFTLDRPAPPVGEVRLRLETAETAADLRGPQVCSLATPAEISAQIAQLGPDPLRSDADPDLAWRRIHRSGKSIAALLMDQTILSGVGNVYRAEVLFRARVDPHRPGKEIRPTTWRTIWADLVELMPHGVADGRIETLRPEHEELALEQVGEAGEGWRRTTHVYTYRRAGEPCLVCGTKIKTELLAGRNLFWCSRCQRRK